MKWSMRNHGVFKSFAEEKLRDHLEATLAGLSQHVHAESPEYLLNVSEEKYLEYLEDKYRVEPLALDFDAMSVSGREENIPAERFPSFD